MGLDVEVNENSQNWASCTQIKAMKNKVQDNILKQRSFLKRLQKTALAGSNCF